MARFGQESRIALTVAVAVMVLVVGAVGVAANRTLPDQDAQWPSRELGGAALSALVAPRLAQEVPLAIGDPSQVIETEWPAGSGQTYRHPTVIARHIHDLYGAWVDRGLDDAELVSMAVHADYLADTISVQQSGDVVYGTWLLPMPNESFDVGPGWTSGFTNAAGALALEQAAVVFPTRSSVYRDAVAVALASFEVPVSDGGVVTEHGDGSCFEEVAYPAEPTCILNGHVFAIGYLYALAEGSAFNTRTLLTEGDAYLRVNLDAYSTPFASKYSPGGKYAEPDGYNQIHGDQMLWMYTVTGHMPYFDAAALWTQFDGSGWTSSVEASQSVDRDTHGPEVLHDGPAWFGYWSAVGEATLVTDLAERGPVCGFNVFWVDGSEASAISVVIDDETVPVHIVAQDVAGEPGYETRPVAYRFDACVEGDRLVVEMSDSGLDVIAVREFDVVVASDGLALERIRTVLGDRPVSYQTSIYLRAIAPER